jgi:hypothetical protein
VAALLGLFTPIPFFSAQLLIENLGMSGRAWTEKLLNAPLMAWPSSIVMMATAGVDPLGGPALAVFAASTLVNVVLYAVVGWLIWIGLFRSRVVLLLTLAGVAALWIRLLSL